MKTKGIDLVFLALLLTVGCIHQQRSLNEPSEEMAILASALTKLSTAAESAIRYRNPPANLSEEQLLAFSTQRDASLLEPFAKYRIRIKGEDKHAIILVCSKDGRALLEDAGCTGKFDMYLDRQKLPCEFTLKASEVCPK